MIIAVTGGRDWNDPNLVSRSLREFNAQHGIDEIHEGGADGWDSWCRQWGRANGFQVITYWANWQAYGRAAGALRNTLILDRAKPRWLVAGPGGKGTANMIMQAEARGIPIWHCRE